MLAAEAERRLGPISDDLRRIAAATEPDPAAVERLRVEVHGMKGLHDIRPKVEPVKSQYLQIIGKQAAEQLKGPYPWD